MEKNLENWLIILIFATVWQNRKRRSWKLLWKLRESILKLKWICFWRDFAIWIHCALVQLELNDRASYRARTLLKNLVVTFWKAQTDRQDSWLVFQKKIQFVLLLKQCDLFCQLKIIVIFLYTRATIWRVFSLLCLGPLLAFLSICQLVVLKSG